MRPARRGAHSSFSGGQHSAANDLPFFPRSHLLPVVRVPQDVSLLHLQVWHRRKGEFQHDAARIASHREKNWRWLANGSRIRKPANGWIHLGWQTNGPNRIMWLEGLEPGRNSGDGIDTFARYVYIHGTGNETTLGRPDSHGCVHLSAVDLIPLYDLLPEGTLVWISEV